MLDLASGNIIDTEIDCISLNSIRLRKDARSEDDDIRRVILHGNATGYIPLIILGAHPVSGAALELKFAPPERQYGDLLREFIRRYCYLPNEPLTTEEPRQVTT